VPSSAVKNVLNVEKYFLFAIPVILIAEKVVG